MLITKLKITSPVENVPVHAADVDQEPGAVQLALAAGQVQAVLCFIYISSVPLYLLSTYLLAISTYILAISTDNISSSVTIYLHT